MIMYKPGDQQKGPTPALVKLMGLMGLMLSGASGIFIAAPTVLSKGVIMVAGHLTVIGSVVTGICLAITECYGHDHHDAEDYDE